MKRIVTRAAGLFLFASASLLAIPNAMAQGTISLNEDAVWGYTDYACTDASCGNANFTLGPVDDYVWRAWWWFRVDGDGAETIFPAPDDDSYVGNVATLDWDDVDGRGFAAQAVDVVTEGAGGSSGTTFQDLTLTNNNAGPLDIEVFFYMDIDANATFGDDEATLINANDYIEITDGPSTLEFRAIGADAYQVTSYAALAALLVDGTPTDLDNTGLPFGPDDFTGAFQWSATIDPGESQLFRGVVSADESAPLVSGWRLLSVPGSGLTVQDLADRNLVQGVTGSYPGGDPNIFLNYDGPTSGDFVAAASTTDDLSAGQGFFWYLFDDSDFGGSTPPPEFVDIEEFQFPLTLGTEEGDDVDVTFDDIPDTVVPDLPAFMLGNAFRTIFDVDGVSVDDGSLQTNFFSWEPRDATYITRVPGDSVSVWEGFWAEVDDDPAAPLTFTLDVGSSAMPPLPTPPPPPPPPVNGSDVVVAASKADMARTQAAPRSVSEANGPPSLRLRLRGTLEDGQEVADLANRLRVEEDAMVAWDRHDGSKFMPPLDTPSYALLSLQGPRNGDAYRQSVRSLPSGLDEAVTIPVGFLATQNGSFEISATPENLPEGWTITLRDLETGMERELSTESYAFEGTGGEDWQERFAIEVRPAGVVGTEDGPTGFRLSNAVPNPAVGSTTLVLRVEEPQDVAARVYDALGRRVTTAHEGALAAGEEIRLEVATADLAAGTYVVRVEGETFAEARRFTVVR